jgi:hypothetical protein
LNLASLFHHILLDFGLNSYERFFNGLGNHSFGISSSLPDFAFKFLLNLFELG